MTTIKKIAMEFGSAYVCADVTMSDGETVKVIFTDGGNWVCESETRNEELEDRVLATVRAGFDQMLSVELD